MAGKVGTMRTLAMPLLVIALLLPLAVSCQVLGLEGRETRSESLALEAAEDAYVVADIAAAEDPEGLKDKNFGSLDFVQVGYVWKVRQEEQVIAIGLFKFNLAPVKEKEITSAHLQTFALRADLTQPVRLVDVHLIDGPWSEAEVTFNKRPPWEVTPIATGAVYGAGVWYSWDVTGSVVRKAREGEVSYAVGLRTLEEKNDEQVLFASREGGGNAPRLLVTYKPPPAAVPWYFWVTGIVVAAMLAFIVGWRLARRRAGRQQG